jgi:hypothetical protein
MKFKRFLTKYKNKRRKKSIAKKNKKALMYRIKKYGY